MFKKANAITRDEKDNYSTVFNLRTIDIITHTHTQEHKRPRGLQVTPKETEE